MAELDRVFRRGGVYWIRSRDEWDGSAAPLGRPAMVVSSDFGNDHSDMLLVAFCTTGGRLMSCNVPISCTEKASLVMCNKVAMIEKDRVGNKLGHASEEEMKKVDEALGMVFGLKLHKSDMDAKLDEMKSQIAGLEEELLAKRVEVAMVEKMYDKALEMLAGVHLTKDLQSPVRKKTEVVAPKVPRIVEDEPEVDEEIEKRTVVRENDGKVNMNTAPAQEIRNRTNLPMPVVYSVTSYRKQNGPYGSLEDLLKAPRFTEYHLREYGKMLTV